LSNYQTATASSVDRPTANLETQDHRLAVSLGCELKYAKKLGYAAAYNIDDERIFSRIGINCHVCPRQACSQRAHQPLFMDLPLDTNRRGKELGSPSLNRPWRLMGSPAGCILVSMCCLAIQQYRLWNLADSAVHAWDLGPISRLQNIYKVTRGPIPFVNVQHTDPKETEFRWIACYFYRLANPKFWFV
jgi:hypothetical protein